MLEGKELEAYREGKKNLLSWVIVDLGNALESEDVESAVKALKTKYEDKLREAKAQ